MRITREWTNPVDQTYHGKSHDTYTLDTTSPAQMVDVQATGDVILAQKAMLTLDGGIATKVVAGEAITNGHVVASMQTTGGASTKVYKCPTTGDEHEMPCGVAYVNNVAQTSTWTRSTTTGTFTAVAHGLVNNDTVEITVSSATTPVPLGVYTITKVDADTFTATVVNSGATSGTATFKKNSVAADETLWIVTGGVARVFPDVLETAAYGNYIGASAVDAGLVTQATAVPVGWEATVGHWLDTGTGAGKLTRAAIHFC